MDGWRARATVGALAAAAALPAVVAGVAMARSGWVPTLDDAFLITRTWDVFSSDTPMIGQYSMAGGGDEVPAHSLGPMLYWVLAVPLRLAPIWVLPIWMGIVNGACFAASVVLAARRGGLALATATTVVLVLLARAIGPVPLAEVWNPWMALAPLVLLAFASWSVVAGDRSLLWLVVVLASFCAQAHLTYVLPATLLVLVAVIGGWRWTWRPVLIALGVGAACWVLPLAQQLTADPGNLSLVADAGGSERGRLGGRASASAISEALGVVPSFASPPRTDASSIDELVYERSTVGLVTGAAAVVGLLAVGAWAVRRRQRAVAGGAAVGLALVGATVVVAGSMPVDRAIAATYSFRWFAIGGAVAWLALGAGGVAMVTAGSTAAARRLAAPRVERLRPAAPVLVGALVAASLGATLAAPRIDNAAWTYPPARAIDAALAEHTGHGGRYLVDPGGPHAVSLVPVVAWNLRRRDRHPVLEGNSLYAFGERYGAQGRPCDGVLVVQGGTDALLDDGRTLVEIDLPASAPTPGTVRLVLLPGDDAGAGASRRC